MENRRPGLMAMLVLGVVAASLSAALGAPHGVGFQGMLTTGAGTSLTDGDYPMLFRVYDTQTGGALLWEETQTVPVAAGVYSVVLGSGTPTTGVFDPQLFVGDERWLEVVVDGQVLAPRQRVTSAAYALQAVNADTVDGFEAADLSPSSHTHSYGNVAIVAQSGGDYSDPRAAMADLAAWCGAPSQYNPCLLRVMPGYYDLGNDVLTMRSYVDIEGSGENATLLTSVHSGSTNDENSATLVGASAAELRFVTVENRGGADRSIAIFNRVTTPKITHVTILASGGAVQNVGVLNDSASPTMTNLAVTVSGRDVSNVGISNSYSSAVLTDVKITVSGGTNNTGVYSFSSFPALNGVTILAKAPSGTTYGVQNSSSSPTLVNATVTASGGTISDGVRNFASNVTIRNSSISGGVNAIYNESNSTAKVAASMIDGLAVGTGYACIGAYSPDFVALNGTCD